MGFAWLLIVVCLRCGQTPAVLPMPDVKSCDMAAALLNEYPTTAALCVKEIDAELAVNILARAKVG